MLKTSTGRKTKSVVRRLAGDEEGQAIFLAVGFLLLLAGLLFLVVNTGDQLNTKVEMQNAADATTATGAAWYARGLNVVSMCNATEAQIMSMIVVLDTLEEVTPHAVECIDELVSSGGDIPIYEPISWLAVGEAKAEQDMIHRLQRIVHELPLQEYCTYDSGVLWQACILLDAFAEEMVEITPLMCQEQSTRVARQNNAEFGVIVPLWPELPVREGTFEDFRDPMRAARMPPPLNTQIGGFTRLFRYGNLSGPSGPFNYFRDPFINPRPMGLFDLSRFSPMFRTVSDMKFDMLFGSEDDIVCLGKWEMNYDTAKRIAEEQWEAERRGLEPEVKIVRTWWEYTAFDSKNRFPTELFYQTIHLRNPKDPQPSRRSYNGWRAGPEGYTRSQTDRECADPRRAVFYKSTLRYAISYPALGIYAPHPPFHRDGTPWPYTEEDKQPYYHTSMQRFNGVELEIDTQLHRRYLPPPGSEPLAPILLDRSYGDNKVTHISARFTFMGFAYKSGKVSEWTTRFTNPNPNPKTVCYAQARVFNPTSWDLFTQDWQVKFVRAEKWRQALQELEYAPPFVFWKSGEQFLTEDEEDETPNLLEPIIEMLKSYSEQFFEETTH